MSSCSRCHIFHPKTYLSSPHTHTHCSFMQGELRQVGMKSPPKKKQFSHGPGHNRCIIRMHHLPPSSSAVSTSAVAVVAGAVLPGDWGFFTSCKRGEGGRGR